jgi:transposase
MDTPNRCGRGDLVTSKPPIICCRFARNVQKEWRPKRDSKGAGEEMEVGREEGSGCFGLELPVKIVRNFMVEQSDATVRQSLSPGLPRRSVMNIYVGLDVSLKDTSVCIVDQDGKVLLERKVLSEANDIVETLQPYAQQLHRVGVEASSLGGWLQVELSNRGFETIVIETHHTHIALKTMRNKTDRNDARGIANLMRLGWFKSVHVKSPEAQRLRTLLSCRKLIVRKLVDTENEIRGTLRGFGLKMGSVSRGRFEARVAALTEDIDPLIQELMLRLLAIRQTLLEQQRKLHALVVKATGADPVCKRFMTVPGVGPIAALAFRTGVDDPKRFKRSRTVGAHFGMTPRKFQSGEVDYDGRISKCGDREVRQALFDAAGSLLRRCQKHSALRAWGLRIAKRSGLKKATVAVSRKLAVILHRMWIDGSEFRWTKDSAEAPVMQTA